MDLLRSFQCLVLLLFNCFLQIDFFIKTPTCAAAERQITCRNARVSERDIARGFFQENLGWQRPLYFATAPINVNVSLVVSSISEISERDRTVKFVGHLSISWIDQFHSWQHSFPHSCIDYVVLKPGEKVWVPDLAQAFSENKNNLLAHPGERIRVHSDGYTSFTPGGSIVALCEFDLSYFPFDYQKCTVRFESWKYTNQHLKLSFSEPALTMKQWQENDMWRLVSSYNRLSRVVYNDADNAYDRVEFIFMLKRKASFYISSIVVPNYLLSLGILCIFSLPPAEVMRLQIAFTCLFAHSLFQLFLMSDLPRSSDNYPLLAMFVDLQMIYVAILLAGQSCVRLFLNLASPENENISDLNSYKLEASMALPLKCYNSICIFGKILRVQAPFSMIVSAPRNYYIDQLRGGRGGPHLKQPNLAFPQGSNLAFPQSPNPFFGRGSSINNSSTANLQANSDQQNVPPIQRSSFWMFQCPALFAGRSSVGTVGDHPAANGDNSNVELLGSDHANAHAGSIAGASSSNAANTSRTPASPSAIVGASNNSTDQTTIRLLVDFRRKLWYFYALVVDRLSLYVYVCCIVLTPLFMGLVSATTWRDVTK